MSFKCEKGRWGRNQYCWNVVGLIGFVHVWRGEKTCKSGRVPSASESPSGNLTSWTEFKWTKRTLQVGLRQQGNRTTWVNLLLISASPFCSHETWVLKENLKRHFPLVPFIFWSSRLKISFETHAGIKYHGPCNKKMNFHLFSFFVVPSHDLFAISDRLSIAPTLTVDTSYCDY
jgi:hypothetical protein